MKSELHKKIREENYAIRFLVYIVGLFYYDIGNFIIGQIESGRVAGQLYPIHHHLYHRA